MNGPGLDIQRMLEWQAALWGSHFHRVYASSLSCNSETSLRTGLAKPKKFVCLILCIQKWLKGLVSSYEYIHSNHEVWSSNVWTHKAVWNPANTRNSSPNRSASLFCPLSRHRLAHRQTFSSTNTLIFFEKTEEWLLLLNKWFLDANPTCTNWSYVSHFQVHVSVLMN